MSRRREREREQDRTDRFRWNDGDVVIDGLNGEKPRTADTNPMPAPDPEPAPQT